MENITFYEQINLFLENKRPRKPLACVHRSDARVRMHEPAHVARVPETMKGRFFYINIEVWNESHIIWEPFQTPIFSLYKAIRGTFPKDKLKILRENPNSLEIVNQRRSFSQNILK